MGIGAYHNINTCAQSLHTHRAADFVIMHGLCFVLNVEQWCCDKRSKCARARTTNSSQMSSFAVDSAAAELGAANGTPVAQSITHAIADHVTLRTVCRAHAIHLDTVVIVAPLGPQPVIMRVALFARDLFDCELLGDIEQFHPRAARRCMTQSPRTHRVRTRVKRMRPPV
jgi:hypothetical protein